jgi:hypothetical protein
VQAAGIGHDYRTLERLQVAAAMSTTDTKLCEICGGVVTRGKRGHDEWAKRKYCSRKCGSVARARECAAVIKTDESQRKSCAVCLRWFTRKPGQGARYWARQECCGRSCATTLFHRKRVRPAPATKDQKKGIWGRYWKAPRPPARTDIPKASTVEEYLALGGRITRIETPSVPGGNPVRSKLGGTMGAGRVR